MTTSRPWRDHALLSLLLIVTFARGLFTPLQASWDDGRFVINNPRVQDVTWGNLVANLSQVQLEAYHPLHLLSYWLDVPWFGANALAIHITSLLLWLLAGACVLTAFRELGIARMPAWFGAALCMIHPIQVEAVTWATGRKDVLALLFSAAAITWHMRSKTTFDTAAWCSRGLFLLAALSKTSVATLPLFLIVLDVGLSRRSWRRAVLQQAPVLFVMLGLGLLTIVTWQASSMLSVRGDHEPGLLLRWSATISHQLSTALWPANNAPMYASHGWAEPHARTLVGPIVVALGVYLLRRARMPLAAAGLLGFVVLLLPASNLLPMVFPLQDRYLSLPLVSLALCVAAIGHALQTRQASTQRLSGWSIAVAACVIALGLRTFQYQGAWQSELALWQHAAATQPRAYYAWMKLGEVRRDAGDMEGSARAYQTMVSLNPEVELGHAALFHSRVLLDEKRNHLPATSPMRLAREFRNGMRDAAAMHRLGQQLVAAGYDEAAAMALDYALTLRPFPASALAANAARFEQLGRLRIAAVLRRHEKQSAQ